jgi:formate dehydrogenase major subunit
MEVTRRQFLKAGAVGAAGATAALGFDLAEARAEQRELKIARTVETRSTCPYCSVSCGLIVHTLGDNAKNVTPSVVHIEGDPDHPINRGTLCPKGITLKDDITHRQRLTRPRVRRPGARDWSDISWDEAIRASRGT